MNFAVLGFYPGQDELVFEQSINLSIKDLMPLMLWTDNTDYIGADFKLSKTQIIEIGRLASLAFPAELDFYLTSTE
ncbi:MULTISPECIES: hypothetical protein [Pseudomonas]|jgi:hypothetical protein|uniref:Uncharacterized protein n=1 Tax=Pseudomonas canavaninivorans TaxID=2842348 RepID=A0ABX8QFD0_PSECO|nr:MULTISPECIES: hypothetical protein [Pseudomonas]QXI53829.1 hypothetical protein KSS97_02410 [Pseudomonas alvandae]